MLTTVSEMVVGQLRQVSLYYLTFVGTFMEIQQSANHSINQGSNQEPNYAPMVYSKSCRTSLIL